MVYSLEESAIHLFGSILLSFPNRTPSIMSDLVYAYLVQIKDRDNLPCVLSHRLELREAFAIAQGLY